MATIGGARVLNIQDKIGSIEEGKKADITIFETNSVNVKPIYDYYSLLVYSANHSNVDTVMVDGNVLVKDKKLVKFSLEELQKDMNLLKRKIEK